MAYKKSKFKTIIIPSFVITVFSIGMVLGIDEMIASQGVYRTTLWDVLNGRGELPKGRAEVSQLVAVQVCKQLALDTYGRNLIQTDFDSRSSRYNGELKVHTIFVDLRVKGKEKSDMYIRCDVSAVNRQIIESRLKGGDSLLFF
jgi:hypothetical protein